MKLNYTEIRQAVRDKREFKGNSCRGYIDNNGVYRIISYQTEIYNSKDGLNLTYYSPTTSKIQGIIAEVVNGLSLRELKEKRVNELLNSKTLTKHCKDLGWQGGTIHQVKAELKKRLNTKASYKKIEKEKPLKALCDNDVNIFKCPMLKTTPKGYKIVNTYFVDNSGFGTENEPALTANQFLSKVKAGRYYAIIEQGLFQVYIDEYVKKSEVIQ